MHNLNFESLRNFLYCYDELRKISRQLHKLDEDNCNFGLTPKQEKRENTLFEKAQNIAKKFGILAYHQGDPRGCSLYLLENEEDGNDYNSKGIAVQ